MGLLELDPLSEVLTCMILYACMSTTVLDFLRVNILAALLMPLASARLKYLEG